VGACFLLIYVAYDTFEAVYVFEQDFYFMHVHYYPPVFNGNRHYLRHSEWLWSKKYFYNQANMPRRHFIEVMFYPHETVLTRPKVLVNQHELYAEKHLDYTSSLLSPRPYYSKVDRMLSTCPSPFWDSFHLLPYDKPRSKCLFAPPY